MPSAWVTLVPDGGGFTAGLVLAIHSKSNRLQLVADVVTNLLALIFGADDGDDGHRGTVELPLAIRAQRGAHALSFPHR